MPDFWSSCGYRFLTSEDGRLRLTDAFLRSLFAHPTLAPVRESCAAELHLHDVLMHAPRRVVAAAELLLIRDTEVQAAYRTVLSFRDRLVAAPTLEAAYLSLFKDQGAGAPPLFLFQLTQVLLRHVLGDGADPLEARMAECLFRVQRICTTDDGARLAVDEEVLGSALDIAVASQAVPTPWFAKWRERLNTSPRSRSLDRLSAENKAQYWPRDERHDFAVDLRHGQAALAALSRVLERWIAHMLGVTVMIAPCLALDRAQWVWHVGLDATASALLNDLYNKVSVDAARMQGVLSYFELRFANAADARTQVAGKPIYLAMAMDATQRLHLKPQNVLLNLPLARL